MAAVRGNTVVFRSRDKRRAGDGDVGTLERPGCDADDEDTVGCVSVSGAVDCFFCGQFGAIAAERSSSMSKSIPSHTRSPGVEGATVGTSKYAMEQFRLHLLERIPDAARVKLRGVSSVEAASGNGLRELWEKSDLPAGIFADEVAGFWRLPRLGLQDLMNVIGAVEHFSPRFLRESSVFPFRAGDDGFGLAVSDPADG